MKITSPRLRFKTLGACGEWLIGAGGANFACVKPLRELFEFPRAKHYWLELSTEPSRGSQPIEIQQKLFFPEEFLIRQEVALINETTALLHPPADHLLHVHNEKLGITTTGWKTFHLRLLYED